jgi:hypothetical protein
VFALGGGGVAHDFAGDGRGVEASVCEGIGGGCESVDVRIYAVPAGGAAG